MSQQNNPYFVQPSTGQALAGLGNAITRGVLQDRERAEQAAAQERQQAVIAEGDALLAANDVLGLQSLMLKNPEIGKSIRGAMNFKDDITKQSATDTAFKILGGQNADAALLERAEFIKNQGGDPAQTLSMVGAPPEQQQRFASMLAAANATPEQLKGLEQMKGEHQMGTGAMTGYSFDPSTGEFSINQEAKAALAEKAAAKAAKGAVLGAKDRQGINKDVTGLIKDSVGISAAAKSLAGLKASSSPSAQLAAIFKFMKSLDPTSVVREGEQQMARSTGGPADYLVGVVNQLKGEGGLPPEVFTDMVATSKNLADTAISASNKEVGSYLDTYEDTIPQSFKDRLTARIPARFEVEEVVTPQGSAETVQLSPSASKYLEQ
ncbi:MAG: hypothetical protein GY770_28310 [Aestuariibacter sp.]|nr:hypothetical protein [Aestuariibacter sp.]